MRWLFAGRERHDEAKGYPPEWSGLRVGDARFWLVLFDQTQVPRLAFDASTRRPRTPAW